MYALVDTLSVLTRMLTWDMSLAKARIAKDAAT